MANVFCLAAVAVYSGAGHFEEGKGRTELNLQRCPLVASSGEVGFKPQVLVVEHDPQKSDCMGAGGLIHYDED